MIVVEMDVLDVDARDVDVLDDGASACTKESHLQSQVCATLAIAALVCLRVPGVSLN